MRSATLGMVPFVLAWALASTWLSVSWFSPVSVNGWQAYVGTTSGMSYAGIARWSGPGTAHFRVSVTGLGYVWGFGVQRSQRIRQVIVPLWAVVALLLLPAAVTWYRRVKSPIRLCPRCEYPVGASPRCTECGKRVASV